MGDTKTKAITKGTKAETRSHGAVFLIVLKGALNSLVLCVNLIDT